MPEIVEPDFARDAGELLCEREGSANARDGERRARLIDEDKPADDGTCTALAERRVARGADRDHDLAIGLSITR